MTKNPDKEYWVSRADYCVAVDYAHALEDAVSSAVEDLTPDEEGEGLPWDEDLICTVRWALAEAINREPRR